MRQDTISCFSFFTVFHIKEGGFLPLSYALDFCFLFCVGGASTEILFFWQWKRTIGFHDHQVEFLQTVIYIEQWMMATILWKWCDLLPIKNAVLIICTQWSKLGGHFSITRNSARCYTAEVLHEMYSDKKNYAYLLYLKNILTDVQRETNLYNQRMLIRWNCLKDFTLSMSTLVKKITLPTVKVDPFQSDTKDFIDFKDYLRFEMEKELH